MKFSWLAFIVPIVVIFVEGYLSYKEKTFWPNHKGGPKIKLPFVYHGGVVVGDLILLPIAFGIWIPQLIIFPTWAWYIFYFASFGITWLCHRAWWYMCKEQPGFMYPNRYHSEEAGGREGGFRYWYFDLPASAWVHFAYMIGALILIGSYIFSPMPANVVWITFWLFVVFVPLAIIEPGIVQGWPPTKKDVMTSVGIATVLWAVLGLVTRLKLVHFWIL